VKSSNLSLAQIINRAVDVRLADLHTAMPARVLRYDAELQQVDVQPLIKVVYENEDGEQVSEALPVIVNVPVMFPSAGGFHITFPVKAGDEDGDTVCVLCSEASLDKWLTQGGLVDPIDPRRHHLSDAVAVLGLRDFAHALSDVPVDAMSMGKQGGPVIHIDGTKVKIGSAEETELEPAGLGQSIQTALNNLANAIATHTHTVTVAVAGASGTGTTAPSGTTPVVPTVTSSMVQVKK
jgi:hypothetical protein